MTNSTLSIDRLIAEARQAIEAERLDVARPILKEAAHLAPDDPRPWLLLAGVAESARERRALLAQAHRLDASGVRAVPAVGATARRVPRDVPKAGRPAWVGAAVVLLLLLAVGSAFALHPGGRAILDDVAGRVSALAGAVPTSAPLAATVMADIPVPPAAPPTEAPFEILVPSPTSPPVFPTKDAVSGGEPLPTWTPTTEPTPTLAPTMTPSPTPEPTATPEPVALSSGESVSRPPGVAEGERWIYVNLTSQTLVAFEGDTPVFETRVSSGLPQWPTVTGQYRTYMKYESQTMNGYLLGYDYYLPDVPYVMYFFEDYAIHGTYWHSNFGTPMSHGCVNVSTPDAQWLFEWAAVGTTVNVTY